MEMRKRLLKAANALFSLLVFCVLFVAGTYSVYALWDNNRVYAAVDDVMADMIKIKPEVVETAEDSGPDFSELLAVNEDVCAWITMDGTAIDYPVVQGETNMTYINKDVYGEFALAGSIFLDSRNSKDFSDPYSLLYGHHMANNKMFGDLDLYEEEAFFRENTTGTFLVPGGIYDLEVICCLQVNASNSYIFEPTRWSSYNINSLFNYVKNNSLYVHEDVLADVIANAGSDKILALSTCSSDFTDARTIVLTVMRPHTAEE